MADRVKKWHPLSNELEHRQYIKALNKGFKRCVLCNRAEPFLLASYVEGDSGEKYCPQCSWTYRDYKTGFISGERYTEAIEESRQAAIRFETRSYY